MFTDNLYPMRSNSFRIFIADDNAQYLAWLGMHLVGRHREVECFTTPQALLNAMDHPPHLVILDYFFDEEAAGIRLLKSLRQRSPEVKVILVSGQDKVEVAIEALKAGAADYIEKDGEELKALKVAVSRCEMACKQEPPHRFQKWLPGKSSIKKLASLFSLLLAMILITPLISQAQHSILPEELTTPYPNPIEPDDKVSVSIWNNDNLSVGSIFGVYNSNEVYGKWVLVNEFGEVNLPLLGTIRIGGNTTREAATLLQDRYGEDVRDPVVVVKVLNREVTVIGEVKEPGNVILDKEQNTLAEVIGQAQGFTDYAKLKKVTLTRKTLEGTEVYELDLRKENAQDMNDIYVRRGDCIQVPERFGKKLERKLPLLIPFASLMTGVGVLYSVTNDNP